MLTALVHCISAQWLAISLFESLLYYPSLKGATMTKLSVAALAPLVVTVLGARLVFDEPTRQAPMPHDGTQSLSRIRTESR